MTGLRAQAVSAGRGVYDYHRPLFSSHAEQVFRMKVLFLYNIQLRLRCNVLMLLSKGIQINRSNIAKEAKDLIFIQTR